MQRFAVALLSSVAFAAVTLPLARAETPSNEDLRHIRGLLDPQLSPDGHHILVEVKDAAADGGKSHLWLVDIAADKARQLTFSPEADKRGEHDGVWMPDGDSILFLAKRGEHTQLWRLPMAGGEARAYDLKLAPPVDASTLPDALPPRKPADPPAKHDPLPVDVADFSVAPDGHSIAVLIRDPETPGEKAQKEAKADALLLDHDLHGTRLYLLDPDSDKLTPTGVAPDVTEVDWSKQGDRLIAIAEPPNDAGDLGPANKAWLVTAADPAHPALLSELPPTASEGAWSDDGKRFYFLAQTAEDAPPHYDDVSVLSLADHTVKVLTGGFSGSVGREAPLPDGSAVYQAVDIGTKSALLRLGDGKPETIAFDTPVAGHFATNAKKTGFVWLGSGSARPTTLYYASEPGKKAKAFTCLDIAPAGWPAVAARLVSWQIDGRTIEGLLTLPPGATGKVPLIIDVHGGPTGGWLDSFEPLSSFLVGRGWAVLRPNPRGSTGYGAAFAAANKNDLGGGDFRDIMAGLDSVIAANPIDTDRLALIGYSYGGEMAGFAEGQTDRFKAIVSMAPVIDQESEYGTENDSWYDRWFYGKPWEHAEDAWRQSPLANAGKAKTPFLLLQGEEDKTDPLGQSLEMYRALKQMGVPVEMVQYPRDDHGDLSGALRGAPSREPWQGVDARQRIVKFIAAAFGKPEATVP